MCAHRWLETQISRRTHWTTSTRRKERTRSVKHARMHKAFYILKDEVNDVRERKHSAGKAEKQAEIQHLMLHRYV